MTIKEKLQQLIHAGWDVKSKYMKEDPPGVYIISGQDYESWIAKCIILFESDNTKFNQTLVKKFIDASKKAVGNDIKYYNTMMGILRAFEDTTAL